MRTAEEIAKEIVDLKTVRALVREAMREAVEDFRQRAIMACVMDLLSPHECTRTPAERARESLRNLRALKGDA